MEMWHTEKRTGRIITCIYENGVDKKWLVIPN